MKISSLTIAVLISGIFLTTASAEDAHREADAHEHGHGSVNIAIEGNRVDIELEAPGSDIIGFEHNAENEAQKAKLAAAKAALANVLSLIKIDAAAGCKTDKADIEFEIEGHDGHEGHDDEDKHASKEASGEEAGHAEFHAKYQITCKDASQISGLAFHYFKVFPGAEELDVNIVTAKKQTKFEVTRDKPEISLVGMM